MDSRNDPRSGGGRRSEQRGEKKPQRPSQQPQQDRRRSGPQQGRRRSGPQQPRQDRRRSSTQQPRRDPEAVRRETDRRQRVDQAARQHQQAAQGGEDVVFKMDAPERRQRQAPRDPAQARRAAQRRRSAQRVQERQKQKRRRSRAPKVVYTQPRPFNGQKLLLQLGIVMAVVLAVMLGLSVFFRVDKVVVYGNKAYSAWTVQEASGIESGERLLSINNARASGKIKMSLPYVDQVRIGINLPDTVNIYITEFDVVYAIQDQTDIWWLMTSGGMVVEQTDSGNASSYTKVLGVKLDAPVAGEDAKAYEDVQAQTDTADATDPSGILTEPPVTVTASDRLRTALSILDALEANDLVGSAASVDVTNTSDINLWYGSRYQVRLGDVDQMDYKIASMKQAIAQLGEYETGILDVSFTTWTEGPFYTPFS